MAATTLHVILFLASIVHLFFVCGVVRCHGVSELRDDGDDDSLGNDGYGRRRDGDRDEYKIHQQVLHKMKAKEEVLFEGGSFKIWWRDVLQFPDVNIEVSEITFEEGGLLLPQYADSDGISYVLEGKNLLLLRDFFGIYRKPTLYEYKGHPPPKSMVLASYIDQM